MGRYKHSIPLPQDPPLSDAVLAAFQEAWTKALQTVVDDWHYPVFENEEGKPSPVIEYIDLTESDA
jgi:hypothetical protein